MSEFLCIEIGGTKLQIYRGSGDGFVGELWKMVAGGVGGGLVIDQRIYHGLPPGEGEFGHLLLDRDGATVESRCSGWAIDQRIRALADTGADSNLVRSLPPGPGNESRFLAQAFAEK